MIDSETPGHRRALAAALALLTRRDFAASDLAARLRRKGHSEEDVASALDRCRELGYLDDVEYARTRARAVLERRPCGLRTLVQDLRRNGVARTMSERIGEEVLAEAGGERAVLQKALDGWIARHGEPADWRSAKRCADQLSRRGFTAAGVGEAMGPWLDELGR